jgi:hypothetical protein
MQREFLIARTSVVTTYEELVLIGEYAKQFNQLYLSYRITEFWPNSHIYSLLLSAILDSLLNAHHLGGIARRS